MNSEDRHKLESWIRAKTTPQRVAFRAQICLLAADGVPVAAIAEQLNTSRPTVLLWKKRFEEQGPDGLIHDAPRGPSPRKLDEETTQAIVDATRNTPPPDGPCWTTRTLAKHLDVSNATVARIWKAHGIRPKKKRSRKALKQQVKRDGSTQLVSVYWDHPLKAMILAHRPTSFRLKPGSINVPVTDSSLGYSQGCSCNSCLFSAVGLLEAWAPDDHHFTDSAPFVRMLREIESQTSLDADLHLILDDSALDIPEPAALMYCGRYSVHMHPLNFQSPDSVERLVVGITGQTLDSAGSADVYDVVRQVSHWIVRDHSHSAPFAWRKRQEGGSEHRFCKAVIETIRDLGLLISKRMLGDRKAGHPEQENVMKWKQKFESWFAAAAFAEEGEHETALRIAETAIPEYNSVTNIIPTLEKAFAAAAFAEENCPDIALAMLSGNAPRRSFIKDVGLENV
ncbi:MAG: helix-turn-helix domain containing protein, partial [Desulfomonile tiedjei]|nr:helix-turn-helix domain containing protein [Desulfomonile tiedjei]